MRPERYSRSAIALHWAIALLLAMQLGLGWRMVGLHDQSSMFAAFQLHKSVGILILVLTLARVGIRLWRPRPAPVESGRATRALVGMVHGLLYLFMIGGPLTGWAVVSTARINIPTRLFGAVPLPHLPLGKAWHDLAEGLHSQLAILGAALILLHVAGALRHHLARSGSVDVVGRMIPVARRGAVGTGHIGLLAGIIAASGLMLAFATPWLALSNSGPPSTTNSIAQAPAPAAAVPAVAPPQPAAPVPINEAAADASDETAQAATQAEEPASWRVLPDGKLGFTAHMNGAAIEGRFDRWTADIQFDPDNLEQSRIAVRIDLASASTNDTQRDSMLQGPDFFGAAGGKATYQTTSIRRTGADKFTARGTLTMNGKSRPVPLAFTLRIDGHNATASGSAALDRTSFGIGAGDWAATDQIAAGVDVTFAFKAKKEDSGEPKK